MKKQKRERKNLHHDSKLHWVLDNRRVTLLYEHFDLQENIEYQDHRLVMMVDCLKTKKKKKKEKTI